MQGVIIVRSQRSPAISLVPVLTSVWQRTVREHPALTVVFAVFALSLVACGGGDTDEDVAELQARVEELEAENAALQAENDELQAGEARSPSTDEPTIATEATIAEPAAKEGGADTTSPSTEGGDSEDASTPDAAYLQGTLQGSPPAGEPNEVSVVAVGPIESSTPVVVRNNTSDELTVHLSATARDAGGALVASGEDQGLEPPRVAPGEIAIGYVYLGFDDPPAGTIIDVRARGDDVDNQFGGVPASIIEHNLVDGEFSQQVVGLVRNDGDSRIGGPINVLVMCFDNAAAPISTFSGFTDIDALEAGQEGSFSVDLFGDSGCPQYLIGASGYPF